MRPDDRAIDDEIRGHIALAIKERIDGGEELIHLGLLHHGEDDRGGLGEGARAEPDPRPSGAVDGRNLGVAQHVVLGQRRLDTRRIVVLAQLVHRHRFGQRPHAHGVVLVVVLRQLLQFDALGRCRHQQRAALAGIGAPRRRRPT